MSINYIKIFNDKHGISFLIALLEGFALSVFLGFAVFLILDKSSKNS